jgi:Putative adhesin
MTLKSAAGAAHGVPGGLRMTPGRWVAVALAVPVALALIGWTGFDLVSTIARGSYPFSYTVPVPGGQATVNVNGGNVTLQQTAAGPARLTGNVQYGLIRPGLTEGTSAAGTSVGINCDGIASDCGMSATLVVPARTAVVLDSHGGDVGISSFTGHLTVSTGGGNINAGKLAGSVQIFTYGGDLTSTTLTGTAEVSTAGGNIDAGDLAGTVRLVTSGGDLTSNAMSGNVQIYSGGGNINGSAVSSPHLTVFSSGGDVTLAFTQPPTNLQITSYGGNITVDLPPGGTRYDILTPNTDGGTVSYPSSLVSSTSQHTITADSGGGDITISQS